jgi:LysM repeat protein
VRVGTNLHTAIVVVPTSKPLAVPPGSRNSLYTGVLLASVVLALSLALGAPGSTLPIATPQSQLPTTLPGLGPNEGVFLITAADDGSRVAYFITQNARHGISVADLQVEQMLNPLWPLRLVSRDELLAFPEGAPIGSARMGQLGAPVAAAPAADAFETEAPVTEPVVAQAPITEPATGTEASTYQLRLGDNLTRIARDHGTTIDAILAANGLANANRVYAGITLVIPGSATAPEAAQSPVEPAAVEAPQTAVAPAPAAVTPAQATIAPAQAAVAPEADAVADVPDGAAATTYVVKPGDSAILIARGFGVGVDALLAANHVVDRNRVYAGMTLVIPEIAAVPEVAQSPAEPQPTADGEATTYLVKPGDSAILIARRYGVDVEALLAANGVANRNRVYAGQTLTIPAA